MPKKIVKINVYLEIDAPSDAGALGYALGVGTGRLLGEGIARYGQARALYAAPAPVVVDEAAVPRLGKRLRYLA